MSTMNKFSLGVENEWTEAGWVRRTFVARPKSKARPWTEKIISPRSADHEQDWQPLPISCTVDDDHKHTNPRIYVPVTEQIE